MYVIFENTIRKYYTEWQNEIIRNGKASGQIKSNNIEKSFEQKYDSKGDVSTAQLLAWKWIVEGLETGRGKTKNGNDGGPTLKEKMEKYIASRDIRDKDGKVYSSREKEIESLAFVMSRSMHEKGNMNSNEYITRPTGTVTDVINENNINQLLQSLGTEATTKFLEEIKNVSNN